MEIISRTNNARYDGDITVVRNKCINNEPVNTKEEVTYMEFSDGYTAEWPYPVNYGKENEIEADVLVLGGGIAGCHAAINAARRGAKVVIVDKGAVIRSGQGGAGVDHWHLACTNPVSKVTPEDMVKAVRGIESLLLPWSTGMV